MTKKRIFLSGMQCVSCSLLIEGELGDIGVDATCRYQEQYVDVVFDEKKTSEKDIIQVIKRLGYGVKEDGTT